MNWLVELYANDKSEAEQYSSRKLAEEAFKNSRRTFLNLANMTPDLIVSGTLTEVNDKGESKIIASFSNDR